MTIKKNFFIFLFYIISLFFVVNKAYAAVSISHDSSAPASSKVNNSFCSEALYTECWNSEKVGATNCGKECINGSTWSHYNYDSCYKDPDRAGWYIAWEPRLSDTCSTGDKYNPGAPAQMKIGFCNCSVGNSYKTCCNGGLQENAVAQDVDPYSPSEAYCPGAPLGDCADHPSRCVYCNQPGQPACGAAACGGGAPPAATATTTPAATATTTPAATATDVPMGPTPAPYVKVGIQPNGNYDFGAKPDNITISKTVGENFSLPLQFWNGNNEINEISTKGIGSLTIRWTLPATMETVGGVVKGDGSPDSGCTVGSQDVSCPLYTGGTFNAGAFDQRKILVRVKTGTAVGTSITIPRATVIFTTDSNPHYPINGRNPGNNWGRNFPCDNCATNYFGNWTFSSNTVTVDVLGDCPGAPQLATMSPNSESMCTTSAILSWDKVPNATHYDIRVDDGDNTTNSASGSRRDCPPHDICINNWTASEAGCATGTGKCRMTINVSKDKNYRWWIHAGGAGSCPASPSSGDATFSTMCAAPTPVPGTISGNVTDTLGNLYLLPGAKVCLDPNAGPPYCSADKISTTVGNGTYIFPSPPQVSHRVFLDPSSLATNYTITGENSVLSTFGNPNANKFNPETVNFTVVTSTPTPTPTPTTGPIGVRCAATCATGSTTQANFTLGFNSISGATSYDAHLFQDSTTVNPVYSQTGRSPGAPSAFDGAQAHNRIYICRVVARDSGGTIRHEDARITAPDCTAPTATPTPPAACGPQPPYFCMQSTMANTNNPPCSSAGISGVAHTECQDRLRAAGNSDWNKFLCYYCPPPPPPPMCNIYPPINEPPQLCAVRPDEHTVDISMQYTTGGGGSIERNPLLSPLDNLAKENQPLFPWQTSADAQSSVPPVYATVYRSKNLGFITSGGGEKVGEQFGGHGISFDTFWSNSQRQIYYYQAEARSGNISSQSATMGVIVYEGRNYNCGVLFDTNPIITSTTAGPRTETTADVIIKFQFSYPFGGAPQTPFDSPVPYLQFIGSSGKPAYIPGNAHISKEGHCFGSGDVGPGAFCPFAATWIYTYKIDLPPNTTDTFAISGYQGELCSQDAQIGSGLVTLSTNPATGAIPLPKKPNLSVLTSTNQNGGIYVKTTWNQLQQGEKINVYRSQTRWQQENELLTNRSYDTNTYTYTFTATDDLNSLPPGKYYYGVMLDRWGQTGFCNARYAPTAQCEIDWKGFAVSGNIFWDTNKNGIKDAGESNYIGDLTLTLKDENTGAIVDTYRCDPTVNPCTGSYTLRGGAGKYLVMLKVPDGYSPLYPNPAEPGQKPSPDVTSPHYRVKTGSPCDTTENAPLRGGAPNPTCTNGSVANADFAIISFPWFQGTGGDIRLDTGISNKIPNNIPAASRYTSIPVCTYPTCTPGVIFGGDDVIAPDFGQIGVSANAYASIPGWLAYGKGAKFAPANQNIIRTSYDYMLQTARQSGITPIDMNTLAGCSTLVNCQLPTDFANGVYIANYTTKLTSPTGKYTFPAGKNYVFLIDGDLLINEELLVPNGSTVTFSVSGKIIINKNIGTTTYDVATKCTPATRQSFTSTNCHVEGFYSADGDIEIEGNNGDCAKGPDKRLNMAGSFIANAKLRQLGDGEKSFLQNRDLCADGLGVSNNGKGPAVTVIERPDFIINAPEFLKVSAYTWQEVAP